jgi:hypothetical protein
MSRWIPSRDSQTAADPCDATTSTFSWSPRFPQTLQLRTFLSIPAETEDPRVLQKAKESQEQRVPNNQHTRSDSEIFAASHQRIALGAFLGSSDAHWHGCERLVFAFRLSNESAQTKQCIIANQNLSLDHRLASGNKSPSSRTKRLDEMSQQEKKKNHAFLTRLRMRRYLISGK